MNRKWINDKILYLNSVEVDFEPSSECFLFSPSQHFYRELEEGIARTIPALEEVLQRIDGGKSGTINSPAIQAAVEKISRHVGLPSPPSVDYQPSVKSWLPAQGNHVAAQIAGNSIELSHELCGRAKILAAVLAHEITHSFLNSRGIHLPDEPENERLTDLASIFLGLGKLVLNGKQEKKSISIGMFETMSRTTTIGYLSFPELAYAYERVNALRQIDPGVCLADLTQGARGAVSLWMKNRQRAWNRARHDSVLVKKELDHNSRLLKQLDRLYQGVLGNQERINRDVDLTTVTLEDGRVFVEANSYISQEHFSVFLRSANEKITNIAAQISDTRRFLRDDSGACGIRRDLMAQVYEQKEKTLVLSKQFRCWLKIQKKYARMSHL